MTLEAETTTPLALEVASLILAGRLCCHDATQTEIAALVKKVGTGEKILAAFRFIITI